MAENSPPLKEMVMKHFIEDDSTTRIIFCTEAFGMGLDCPNITQVIHYSPSQTAEGYIQEIGRGGRNGQQAVALCIHTPTSAPINKDMKQYVRDSHADIAKDLKVATTSLYYGDIFTARGREESPVPRNSDNRKKKLRPILFKCLNTKERKAFATWLEQTTNFTVT
jgi:superfamily II DNA helicase RecQ